MFGRIPVWLLDVVNPDYNFNISDYYNLAWEAVFDIWKRGKLSILVGGSGFYLKAVVDGIGTMGVLPNTELRQELSILSVELLSQKLKKMDQKRKLKNQSANWRTKINPPTDGQKSKILWIGLTAEKKILYEKIDRRVDERLKIGAVEETKKLAKKYGWDISSMSGIGYRQLRQYIEGKVSLDEAAARWKRAEHDYAQKQQTWFKKDKRIIWFNAAKKDIKEKVAEVVREWYTLNV
ncbi:hypothetical protein HYT17_00480 [Candidatus Microgenomates bacterium]|nr:hypothetical protein [Candidatus Microgenomates bacterium]